MIFEAAVEASTATPKAPSESLRRSLFAAGAASSVGDDDLVGHLRRYCPTISTVAFRHPRPRRLRIRDWASRILQPVALQVVHVVLDADSFCWVYERAEAVARQSVGRIRWPSPEWAAVALSGAERDLWERRNRLHHHRIEAIPFAYRPKPTSLVGTRSC